MSHVFRYVVRASIYQYIMFFSKNSSASWRPVRARIFPPTIYSWCTEVSNVRCFRTYIPQGILLTLVYCSITKLYTGTTLAALQVLDCRGLANASRACVLMESTEIWVSFFMRDIWPPSTSTRRWTSCIDTYIYIYYMYYIYIYIYIHIYITADDKTFTSIKHYLIRLISMGVLPSAQTRSGRTPVNNHHKLF
jgi:hypothetical protein